jgi:hypothetical protein
MKVDTFLPAGVSRLTGYFSLAYRGKNCQSGCGPCNAPPDKRLGLGSAAMVLLVVIIADGFRENRPRFHSGYFKKKGFGD